MGVRAQSAAPPPRARPAGPGAAATLVVVLVALALLLANRRPVGTTDASGAAGWLLHAGTALASLAFELDTSGAALLGKAMAALFAALAAGALFAAVTRRHGLVEGRWAGLLLALGTTLAAAAQAWSGEAAATCAVACAVLLLVRSEEEDEAGLAAKAGLPLGRAAALQPSTGALVLVLVAAVLVRWRREGLLVLAWAAPGVLAALAFLASTPAVAWPTPGAAALVVSPAKSVLLFAPVALVGLAGLLRVLRAPVGRLWDQPGPTRMLPIACGLAAVAHFASLALAGGWAAGDFWGPRWAAPAWPLLLLFLPEGFALLKTGASLLALASVAVQALGAFAPDGPWAWERVTRLARPVLEGRLSRDRALAGASGSLVSFATLPLRPTGVEATLSGLRIEGEARVSQGRLELKAAGDGLAFRVREGAWPRRLEVRITGRGKGTIGLGESGLGAEPRWRDRAVSGPFRFRLPYHYPESGGADLRVALRSGGPLAIESVALVPPTEPESVLRLP
jgi:hypothetical protein